MPSSSKYMRIYEAYVKAFPRAVMFDSRAMAGEDFDRLEEMMETALERGFPMTDADLMYPVLEPDPKNGLLF